MSTIKIKLRGQELPKETYSQEDKEFAHYSISKTFTIENSTRSDVPEQILELGEDEILELGFEDNSFWLGDTESIKQIFAKDLKRGGDGEVIELSGDIETDEQDRSIVQKVAIKAAKVFVKDKVIRPGISALAKKAENAALKFNDQVFDSFGPTVVLSVGKEFELSIADTTNLDVSKKYLLLIHGTGSSTLGSFGEMKKTPEWEKLVESYGEKNILALQHRTLTCSPLQNVLAAVEALPAGISLDLITHSRGGLVADLLARFVEYKEGFGEDEKELFKSSDRQTDLDTITEIHRILENKPITIGRVIRVACPANGTTLASKRLDWFLNTMINLLGVAIGGTSNPVFLSLKELVLAAVETKDDVTVLPGLESMNPDSPFIKALNFQGTDKEIKSQLLVIAGSSELSVSFKSLVVLLGKFFFRGKNDLVVDTLSMEFGAKRAKGSVFIYQEQSGKIDHITYFKTEKVRKNIQTGLLGKMEEFAGKSRNEGITLLRAQDRGGLVLEGGTYHRIEVGGKRPILVLLPGIMGSNLKEDKPGDERDKLLWINYGRFLKGHLKSLARHDNDIIEADSLIKTSYRNLGEFLSNTYDVVTFPFDWRLDMKANASLLNIKMGELVKYDQPIKMVGHSMGGVLVRDFMLYHPDTYQKLKDKHSLRVLFLGSPLGGSYRIPYVLFGKDSIIRLLGKIDIKNSTKDLLHVFVHFPGILALLPLNHSGKHDFSDRAFWERLRKASGDESWPIPSEKNLNDFRDYQQLVLENRDKKIDYSDIYYIAGQSRSKNFTVSDLEIKDGQLLFHTTTRGDESVTWESGIPDKIKELKNYYYANVTHGGLTIEKQIFGAIGDILLHGKTTRLQNVLPEVRGEEKKKFAVEEEIFDISEENTITTLLGLGQDSEASLHENPVHVRVSHGDLGYADYPVLAGHFEFDSILTTEKAIDGKLNGELSRLLSLGLYPGPIGTHQIVMAKDVSNSDQGFKGTIVVGLGVPGELTPFQLMTSVSKGISRYLTIRNERVPREDLRELTENPVDKKEEKKEILGISVIALANSYGGLSNETSIRAILLGIQDANRKVRAAYKGEVKVVEEIEIIELYQDRALGILKTIKNLEQDGSREFNISVPNLTLTQKMGRKSRIPFDNTSDWWTRIKVTEESEWCGEEITGKEILMAISTNGAKEKELPLQVNIDNFESLLEAMTSKNQFDPEIAKLMFEVLIPFSFKEELKRQNNITWVLDKRTASFPWEMLQEDVSGVPLCIHSGMVRQLATMDFRKNVSNVFDKKALVIGDPDLKGFMPQLRGAEKEGSLVSEKLKNSGFETLTLIKGAGQEIFLKFFTQNYKIVHLAGHGVFDPKKPKKTGMVIGNGNYLTPGDIANLSRVPEFVFVNCCYLGQMDAKAEDENQNKNRFAANIGTQLIEIGVKAVIVTGWAIDDAAALDFCERFYDCLLAGNPFGEATKSARKFIYEKYKSRNNTWGAYQCYGDPFFRLDVNQQGPKNNGKFYMQEEVELDLLNMISELEVKNAPVDSITKKFLELEEAIQKANMVSPKIYEYRAEVYSKLGQYAKAKESYEKLFQLEKANYSLKSVEQYCNVSCKYWVEEYQKEPSKNGEALDGIDSAILWLDNLKIVGKTIERCGLLGSAYKRKLMVMDVKDPRFSETLQKASDAYFEAANLSKFKNAYPLNNAIQLRVIQSLLSKEDKSMDFEGSKPSLTLIQDLKEHLSSKQQEKKDYWDLATDTGTLLSEICVNKVYSEEEQNRLTALFENLWKNGGSPSDKKAEIEHLDVLIKGLSILKSGNGKKLLGLLKEVKIELVNSKDGV